MKERGESGGRREEKAARDERERKRQLEMKERGEGS